MRMWAFAGRNAKEFLRDPLQLGFSLGFPLVLLLLLGNVMFLLYDNMVPKFEIIVRKYLKHLF